MTMTWFAASVITDGMGTLDDFRHGGPTSVADTFFRPTVKYCVMTKRRVWGLWSSWCTKWEISFFSDESGDCNCVSTQAKGLAVEAIACDFSGLERKIDIRRFLGFSFDVNNVMPLFISGNPENEVQIIQKVEDLCKDCMSKIAWEMRNKPFSASMFSFLWPLVVTVLQCSMYSTLL